MLRRMNDGATPADYVAVEVAGKATGIPARTLRYWISTGKLAAIAGKRGKLVSMGEVARIAQLTGKSPGNAEPLPAEAATSATSSSGNLAGKIADPAAGGALVSDLARQQLATIRDEWLAPLIARMGELERENGRLEAERDAQVNMIAELRRRAEVAEAEVARRQEVEAARRAKALAVQTERQRRSGVRRSGAFMPATLDRLADELERQEAQGAPPPPSPTPWARLRAFLRGDA